MEAVAQAYQKAKNLSKSDSTDYLSNVVKGTAKGAVTGAVIGLIIGHYKHYNLFGSAIVGIIGGGLVSNFFIKYNNN